MMMSKGINIDRTKNLRPQVMPLLFNILFKVKKPDKMNKMRNSRNNIEIPIKPESIKSR